MITEYTIELRMEKSIQRITQPICVRINENETQLIRAKLTYENNPYSIQCDSAELHLLRDDGTWSHLEASVNGSSVTCTIKANQLGKHAQNACAYFFFKQGTQTETTESFQMRVERAAVDTEASDAFFDASMNRIATKWGAYEATAEAQERARQDEEGKRKQAEHARISAEQLRVQAEQARAASAAGKAEQERKDAEQVRISAEQQRKDAEQLRQSRFNEMLDAVQNMKFHILSDSEVDSEGKPTIQGKTNTIYLVKAQASSDSKYNHYVEWMYINDSWEIFGTTAPTVEPIGVDDINTLDQRAISGNRVLNATGLSVLWTNVQSKLRGINGEIISTQSRLGRNEQQCRLTAEKFNQLSEELKKKIKESYDNGVDDGTVSAVVAVIEEASKIKMPHLFGGSIDQNLDAAICFPPSLRASVMLANPDAIFNVYKFYGGKYGFYTNVNAWLKDTKLKPRELFAIWNKTTDNDGLMSILSSTNNPDCVFSKLSTSFIFAAMCRPKARSCLQSYDGFAWHVDQFFDKHPDAEKITSINELYELSTTTIKDAFKLINNGSGTDYVQFTRPAKGVIKNIVDAFNIPTERYGSYIDTYRGSSYLMIDSKRCIQIGTDKPRAIYNQISLQIADRAAPLSGYDRVLYDDCNVITTLGA